MCWTLLIQTGTTYKIDKAARDTKMVRGSGDPRNVGHEKVLHVVSSVSRMYILYLVHVYTSFHSKETGQRINPVRNNLAGSSNEWLSDEIYIYIYIWIINEHRIDRSNRLDRKRNNGKRGGGKILREEWKKKAKRGIILTGKRFARLSH